MAVPRPEHVEKGAYHVGVQSLLFRCVEHMQRKFKVRVNEASFMAVSGQRRRRSYEGRWRISQCISWRNVKLKARKVDSARNVVEAMAEWGHLAPDYKCVEQILGRSQGGRGGIRPSVEGEDPGELWFRQENSVEETQALMRLEG